MPQLPPLRGIIPPVITPTGPDDRVDEPALRNHIRWLISQGVNGLFLGGTAGEGPLLAAGEWRRLMEIAFDEAGAKLPLLAGAIDTSTRRVIDRIQILKQIGYGYFVVTPTFYVPGRSHEEQMRLFGACVEAGGSGMQLVPYNLPSVTQATIAVETFVELGRRGWAKYCKESSGDSAYQKRLLAEAPPAGLTVLMGNEINAAEALFGGAKGLVSVCANIEPRTYIGLFEAAGRDDHAEAERFQRRIRELVDRIVLSGPCFLAGPKHLVARRIGAPVGKPVSPLQPVSAELAKKIESFFDMPFS